MHLLRRYAFSFALLLPALASGSAADAKPPLKRAKLEPPAQRAQPAGRSVGSPTEGHLVGGMRLGEAPWLRIVPTYAQGDVRWGIEPLVGAIERAARAVRRQFPDAVLSVGHLSRPGGGELDRHASHESGRDADVGFYVKNERNKPIYADHFVPFRGDGTAPTWPGARFDDARNWAFVAAIVGDAHARVTHVFVATPIRQRLLDYAARIGAPLAIRIRASELMAQPRGALPHDDHFHVRVGCPAGMEKCIEQPTARHHRKHPAATAHVKPATPPHVAKPAPPSPAPSGSAAASKDDDTDDSTPTLGPMVPGLDSAVIPKPIEGMKPSPPPTAQPMPQPVPAPPVIDDPDGIYEQH